MALARVNRLWVDKVADKSKQTQWIYDIVFSPNGSYILVAAGNLILVTIRLQTKQICLKEGCGPDFHSLFTKWTKLY